MYLRSALSRLPRIYALLILCSGLASPQMSSAAKNEDSIDGLSEVTFDDDVSDQEDESSTRYLQLGLCIPQDRLEEVDFSPNFADDWIRLDHAFEPDFELHNDVRYNQDSPKAACDRRDHGEVEEIEINNVQEQNFRGKPLVFEVPCDDERKFGLLNKKPRMKILRKGNRISTFPIRRRGDGKRSSMYSKARERKRRCTHCQAEETPQWRLGPSGPNTLCNACGLRYKVGKLVPNYRPAASPSFDSAKHSNFYRRLMREK